MCVGGSHWLLESTEMIGTVLPTDEAATPAGHGDPPPPGGAEIDSLSLAIDRYASLPTTTTTMP